MILCQPLPHHLAFLLLRHAPHGGFEKEDPQDGEEADQFEYDEPDQRFPPGQVPESVPVEGQEEGNDSFVQTAIS